MSCLDSHLEFLKKSCRVCGHYYGEKHKEQFYECSNLIIEIYLVFGVDISDDKRDIHPSTLCHNCYAKCLKSQKNQFYKTATVPIRWKEHGDDNCEICELFEKKRRGGRKRKLAKGRGRPQQGHSKAPRSDPSSHPVQIPPDVIPAPISEEMPAILRFHRPPEDLVCPICKEVLEQPLQSSCQHLFCFKCVDAWVTHAGNSVKCPTCQEPWSSATFCKVPRVILNILSALLVACSSCKQLVQLDRLQLHEKRCNEYVSDLLPKTLAEVLDTALDVPLTTEEERLTTHLVKRKLSTSTNSEVLLRTGGSVSRIIK